MTIKKLLLRQLFSLLTRNSGQALTILQFHKIPRDFDPLVPGELLLERFETVLDFFVEQMTVLPLTEALQRVKAGTLKKNVVALTFDDGYPEWAELVAPLLKRRNLSATFYVTTEQLDGNALWHERIAAAVRAAPKQGFRLPKGFSGYESPLNNQTRSRLVLHLQERLKYMPLAEREVAIRNLEAQAETPLQLPKNFSSEQVRYLHSQGFEIGAHTVRHPILVKVDDREALEEIGGAKETLEAIIAGKVTSFAYPNGLVDRDFSERDVKLAKKCGYESAVITGGGVVDRNTNLMLLPRFTPWGPSQSRMALQIARNLRSGQRRTYHVGEISACKKPKVLYVECGAGFGGAVIALETLLKYSKPEHSHYEVVTNLPVGSFANIPAVKSLKVISNRHLDVRPLAKRIQSLNGLPAQKTLLFALGRLDDIFNRIPYLLQLAWHVLKRNPDIIHGNNEPSSNREAMIIAKLLNKPYIQHLRGPIAESTHTPWLLTKPDAFIPVSRWLAEELLVNSVPSGKIHQIYDAVDFDENPPKNQSSLREELKLPADSILVAMVGMLVPWKGQEQFIDAVALLPEFEQLKVFFLLIGGTPEMADSDYAAALHQKVADYRLEERILFTGKRTDLKIVMRQINIVVSCSTEPEPLGLVMLEGMANGCLFIGPAFGAATEVVEDGINGLLYEPRSTNSLVGKLEDGIKLVAGQNTLSELGKRSVIAKFRGESCAKDTLYVQTEVL